MSHTFVPMIDVLPEAANGDLRIEHFDVSDHESRMSAFRSGEWVPPGRYARLMRGKAVVMSDTRFEHRTNYGVVGAANGNVLIAGLGMGMILIPILRNPAVRSVTVVEIDERVIALVLPALQAYLKPAQRAKLTVVQGDISDWKPSTKGRQFDTMYFDIWGDQSTDCLEEMAVLRRRFAPFLVRGGWSSCWRQDELRSLRRRGA